MSHNLSLPRLIRLHSWSLGIVHAIEPQLSWKLNDSGSVWRPFTLPSETVILVFHLPEISVNIGTKNGLTFLVKSKYLEIVASESGHQFLAPT